MNPSYPLRIFSVLFVSSLLSPSGPLAAPAPAVYRINCGGDKFADDSGRFWQADAWYKGGKAHSEWNDTYATENKHLFLTWRYQDTLAMRYAFPAPAGNYKVRLHFAEHDTSVTNAGMRVFRVLANGKTLIDSLDIYKEVFARVALTKEFIVASKNDSVVITFAKMVYDPIVSGIEVYPEAWKDEPYPMAPPYRLACGGMGFTDPKGNVWLPDGAYGEGGRNSTFTGSIANTDLPMLYLSERWDNSFSSFMTYAFPVPDDRNYVVRLHFAETHKPAAKAGARMFDININDTLGYANMDIFAAAGFATATTLELNATRAADGVIHLAFISTADAAKVNGIEVFAGVAAVGIVPSAPIDRHGEGAFRGMAMGPGRIRAEVSIPGPHSLVLFDPAGRKAAWRAGTGPSASEFSGLRPGLYLLRLQGGAGTWVRRTMVPR